MNILLIIGVWILAVTSVFIFFQGAKDRQDRINIRFLDYDKSEVIDHKPTLLEQLRVVERETKEFETAVIKSDYANAIEEYYDVKQAMENQLQLMGLSEYEIRLGEYKHYQKLKDRGWIFKGEEE